MPADTAPKPLSVQRNMLFNSAGSLFYQGCLWLITVLVVVLSNNFEASGMLAFAMTVGNMYTAIATYSMRTYQVSDVDGRYAQAAYVAFRIITVIAAFILLSVYGVMTAPSIATLAVTLIFLLFKIDESFCDVLYGVDQAGGRMDYIGISQFLRGFLVVAAFSIGMLATGKLVVAVAIMAPLCLAVTLVYDLPHASRFSSLAPRITKDEIVALLRECAPLVISTLLMTSVVAIARQWFGITYGMEELGLYAAVATPAVLIQAGARFLYAPALVPLAQRWGMSDRSPFSSYLKRVIVIMLIASAVTVIGLSICGPALLVLVYGQGMSAYTYLFTNVLLSTAVIAFLWLLCDVLVICRDLSGALIATIAAFLMAVVLMVPLENAYGMQGINYTVIFGMLTGILAAALRISRAVRQI